MRSVWYCRWFRASTRGLGMCPRQLSGDHTAAEAAGLLMGRLYGDAWEGVYQAETSARVYSPLNNLVST